MLKPDAKPGELVGVAIFEDHAAYAANADDLGQDQLYQRLRALLLSDPE